MSLDRHRRFFEIWSTFYGSTPFVSGYLRSMQDKAVESLGLRRGSRVLDLGCGPGDGLRRLVARGHHPVGGDLSARMAKAARFIAPTVRLTADALPFRDGAFDGLMCTNSFHHYPDPDFALSEMRRVLRFGGHLVLIDPSGDDLLARLTIHLAERKLFGMRDVHLHRRREWVQLLERANFADIRIRNGGHFDPRARASVLLRATAA